MSEGDYQHSMVLVVGEVAMSEGAVAMSEGDNQHCMVLVVGCSCYVRGRHEHCMVLVVGSSYYVRERLPTLHGACSGEQLLCQRETTNTAWCL